MLVLTRKVRESVLVKTPSGAIWISIGRISGGRVRIGIHAPEDCSIMRSEIAGQRADIELIEQLERSAGFDDADSKKESAR